VTIKIPLAVETDLVIKIAEGLQTHLLNYDFILINDFSWAEKLMELLPPESRDKVERFVGERNIAKLISTEIDNELDRCLTRIDVKKGQPATQLSFIHNPILYARKLVEIIKSLPIRYRLTAALPETFSCHLIESIPDSVVLPSGITISKGNALPNPLPTNSEYPSVDTMLFYDWVSSEKADRSLKSDRLYFSMDLLGYATPASSSVMGRQFEDHIRAFYGAAMAVRVMSYGIETKNSKLPYIMIHSEDRREILSTEPLEDDLLEYQSYCSSRTFAQRKIDNLSASYAAEIKKIGTIFNDSIDCRRLFAACIWYYRAKVNRRPLDAILQATIAIEVMLGDRKSAEGIGLTNLLASRCAYLLGRSSSHRIEIEEKFRKVYDLRSQIVHEGRHVIKLSDRDTIKTAISLCAAIISKELTIRALPEA
jgi:hypothetical protein